MSDPVKTIADKWAMLASPEAWAEIDRLRVIEADYNRLKQALEAAEALIAAAKAEPLWACGDCGRPLYTALASPEPKP